MARFEVQAGAPWLGAQDRARRQAGVRSGVRVTRTGVWRSESGGKAVVMEANRTRIIEEGGRGPSCSARVAREEARPRARGAGRASEASACDRVALDFSFSLHLTRSNNFSPLHTVSRAVQSTSSPPPVHLRQPPRRSCAARFACTLGASTRSSHRPS